MQTRIQDATINAQAAFFAEIAKAFPEIETCNFSSDATRSFSKASKAATAEFKFNEACLAATTTLVESSVTATSTDIRSIANDPKLFLEELGYTIIELSDKPGFWIWTAAADNCDSPFPSAKDALEGAWIDAVAGTMGVIMSVNRPSSDDWNAMTFEQQKRTIIETLGFVDYTVKSQ